MPPKKKGALQAPRKLKVPIIPGVPSLEIAAAMGALQTEVLPMKEKKKTKPKKITASDPSDTGERPLADYCTTFRGRGVAPAADKKKRPAAEIRAAAEAKKKKLDQIKANAAARPALRVGADGSFVLQQALIGGVDSDEEEDYREEVHEEQGLTSTYASFTDRTRTERWGMEETRRFFQSLRQCGTDFTLMLTQFPGRNQKQLKNKFKKESKSNQALVDAALNPKIAKPLDCAAYAATFGAQAMAPIATASDAAAVGAAAAATDAAEAAASSVASSPQNTNAEQPTSSSASSPSASSSLAAPSPAVLSSGASEATRSRTQDAAFSSAAVITGQATVFDQTHDDENELVNV